MKKTNRMISIILALIIAVSCISVGAMAANVDAAGNYILKPSAFKAGATKFALCETVHGNVGKGEQWYYSFYVPAAQSVVLYYTATSQINFQIETATGVSVYSNPVLAGNSSAQFNLGGGWYYVRVANTASSDLNPNVRYTFTVLTASPAPLSLSLYMDGELINPDSNSYLRLNAGQEKRFSVETPSIPNLNFFWRVLDDPETIMVDESKFISVSDDGVLKVNYWTPENKFEEPTIVKVQAICYYYKATDHTIGETWTKTFNIYAYPASFTLTPDYNMDSNPLLLTVGTMQQVTATPMSGIGTFKWESMNPAVASVDNFGRVTGVSEGTTYIRVTLIEDSGFLDFKVNVTTKPIYRVSGISFVSDSVTLSKIFFRQNPSKTLTVNNDYKFTTLPAAPDGIPTNSKVTFTSSDPAVVQVDPTTGTITAYENGEAIITVTTDDGGYTDTVTVKVVDGNPIVEVFSMILQGLLTVLRWLTGGGISLPF